MDRILPVLPFSPAVCRLRDRKSHIGWNGYFAMNLRKPTPIAACNRELACRTSGLGVSVSVGVGQTVAGSGENRGWRKVRAPQGRMVGNADRSRDQGQCHRKQTAGLVRLFGVGLGVRVKR